MTTFANQEALVKEKILLKNKIGRDNYYIKQELFALLSSK